MAVGILKLLILAYLVFFHQLSEGIVPAGLVGDECTTFTPCVNCNNDLLCVYACGGNANGRDICITRDSCCCTPLLATFCAGIVRYAHGDCVVRGDCAEYCSYLDMASPNDYCRGDFICCCSPFP